MTAAWFKGVQLCICLDNNEPLIHYFINALGIPFLSLSTIATIVTCAPEPITAFHSHMHNRAKTAELTSTTYKQIYTCSSTSWTGILPAVRSHSVHLNWLLWINETKRVRTESVPVWGDPDTRGQQSGIRICGCPCVACFSANIAVMFALCLVQEETVKMGFCHKSVRKQQVWLLRNWGSCVIQWRWYRQRQRWRVLRAERFVT